MKHQIVYVKMSGRRTPQSIVFNGRKKKIIVFKSTRIHSEGLVKKKYSVLFVGEIKNKKMTRFTFIITISTNLVTKLRKI